MTFQWRNVRYNTLPSNTIPIVIHNSVFQPCHASIEKAVGSKFNDGKTSTIAGKIKLYPSILGKKKVKMIRQPKIIGDINIPAGASNSFRSYVSPLYFPKKV